MIAQYPPVATIDEISTTVDTKDYNSIELLIQIMNELKKIEYHLYLMTDTELKINNL